MNYQGSTVFELNKYLSVQFRSRNTVIYVRKEPFIACKYLFMNAPSIESAKFFDSIDQMSESLNGQLEREITREEVGLSPEDEFWGHCSNLQVWVENDYDTCLLHRNLAFPLLKKLTTVGDAKAKKIFSKEVAKRFKSRSPTVQKFLVLENHMAHLRRSILRNLINYADDKEVLELLSARFRKKNDFSNNLKALKRLLWIDPIHRKAHLVLAFVYLNLDNLKKAKIVLKELLKLYPKDDEAISFLAQVYWFKRNTNKANELVKELKNASDRFIGRKEFVQLSSYKFSFHVPADAFRLVKHRHGWFFDFP